MGRNCAFNLWRWIGDRAVPFRRTGGGEDPRRANLNRYQLHDGVQFAGRELPDHVPHPGRGADGRRYDRRQCQSEHGLSAQLHDPTDQLSNTLRANFAFAVGQYGSD